MPRVLAVLVVALVAAAGLGGCATALAAVLAPEVAAGQAAEATAAAAADGLGALASDGNTLGDLDRILSNLPPDSDQRQDLLDLKQQIGEGRSVRPINGAKPRFASDPKGGLEYDRRAEDADDRATGRVTPAGFTIPSSPTRGHVLLVDPPRIVGSGPQETRTQPNPFHVARESDLDPYEPRYYGPSMPPLPPRPDRRDRDAEE